MRVVVDTCVIVAALRSRNGASRMLFDRLVRGDLVAVATPACFLEYEEVLARPEQVGVHGYSAEALDRFLDGFAQVIELVRVRYSYRPQLRDADDEFVLEAAINGSADAIVTFNVSDFLPAAETFGVEVLSPGRIIRERLGR